MVHGAWFMAHGSWFMVHGAAVPFLEPGSGGRVQGSGSVQGSILPAPRNPEQHRGTMNR